MDENFSKKNKLFVLAINTIVFIFFLSFAIRISVLKEIQDLVYRIVFKLEGFTSEFISTNSLIAIINRVYLTINNTFLPIIIIYTSIFSVVFLMFLQILVKYGLVGLSLKEQASLYFNKSNSKQYLFISTSKMLC